MEEKPLHYYDFVLPGLYLKVSVNKDNKVIFEYKASDSKRAEFVLSDADRQSFYRFLSSNLYQIMEVDRNIEISMKADDPDDPEYSGVWNYKRRRVSIGSIVTALSQMDVQTQMYIALPTENIPLEVKDAVLNAAGNLMEVMGFELVTEEEPIHGSFFQREWWKSKFKRGQIELDEVYDKAKQALEAQHLQLPYAQATGELAKGAAELLIALKDQDEACIRCGALLVVKTVCENKKVVMIETISPRMATVLDTMPTLIQNPSAMYQLLLTEKAKDKLTEGGDQVIVG